MQDFLTYILKPLVDDVNQIDIDITDNDTQSQVTLHVPQEYMGHIIGKQGKTINSIRQIIRLWGHLNNKQILINLQEKGAPAATTTE